MRILNVGSLNIDYVYEVNNLVKAGETVKVKKLIKTSGGKGLNQSISCSKAGLEVYHLGMIGREGQFLCDELSKNKVKTDYVTYIDDIDGHAIIQVNNVGQNCILVYPGTNDMLSLDMVRSIIDKFTSKDVLLVQNETNLVSEIIELASNKGMRIAFNPSPISEDILDYPIDKVDWLFVNQTEGEVLSNEYVPINMLERLIQRFPSTEIILTLGINGCMIGNEQGIWSYPTLDVPVVDTTGAGDTFTGYYLRGILMPIDGVSAAECATIASNIAITRRGASQSIPSIGEVLEYLDKNPKISGQSLDTTPDDW